MFWGEEPLSRTSIERIKNIAVSKSGVKKIRIHDFRHSHASNLIGEGMDIVAVSKRLGHSSVDMTLKV
ncbi:MAG: tyrosine-type recombinase/integrase [Erysipelotrichaceae bacterium]|nr:tyrosine-type recombinase/integrase [Erysipelotrichaceae bacterium]